MVISSMMALVLPIYATFLLLVAICGAGAQEPLSRSRRFDYAGLNPEFQDCPEKFKKLSKYHGMCLKPKGTPIEITQEIKDKVVESHNDFRSKVNPPATNMQKMAWSDALAEVAQSWATQCIFSHDGGKERESPDLPWVSVGQNLLSGSTNVVASVGAWHSEVKNFLYGVGRKPELPKSALVGHYTAVVQSKSALVGCGAAKCPNAAPKVVCNYANIQYDFSHPYKNGTSCSACPKSCKNNLCDCGGKTCLNGGKIDINSCKCSCPSPYQGDTCENANCASETVDQRSCSYSTDKESDRYCATYLSHRSKCPRQCKICPAFCNGKKCQNFGYLNPATCKCECSKVYTGDLCETKNCDNSVVDTWWCESRDVSYCKKFISHRMQCPRQCGTCPKFCGGKKCINGGKLNVETCKCACNKPYEGETCEIKNCSKDIVDKWWCFGRVQEKDCNAYKGHCPRHCGVCPKFCDGKRCINGGSLDIDTCKCTCNKPYEGDTCEIKNCSKDVLDKWWCFTNVKITQCNAYKGHCPRHCGVCPKFCDGKRCVNGGTLDIDTCKCTCKKPYEGDTCEKKNCDSSVKDVWYCKSHVNKKHCNAYKPICPRHCGVCPEE